MIKDLNKKTINFKYQTPGKNEIQAYLFLLLQGNALNKPVIMLFQGLIT